MFSKYIVTIALTSIETFSFFNLQQRVFLRLVTIVLWIPISLDFPLHQSNNANAKLARSKPHRYSMATVEEVRCFCRRMHDVRRPAP